MSHLPAWTRFIEKNGLLNDHYKSAEEKKSDVHKWASLNSSSVKNLEACVKLLRPFCCFCCCGKKKLGPQSRNKLPPSGGKMKCPKQL